MTDRVFRLPDLGEGLHEAEIVAWHVGVGDHVVTDQPLVSVETDKAVVEVPSPQSGHVTVLHGEPGDVLESGEPLVEFTTGDAADKGTVVGDLDGSGPEDEPRLSQRAPTGTKPARAKAMPAVRKLAEQLGVDVASVEGSGPAGVITQRDVRTAASKYGSRAESISGVRRAMLKNMARSGREVVPAVVTDEVDVEAWVAKSDVTIRLVRAVEAGCKAAPSLNAWFDSRTETRTVHEQIDLGLAVETDEGLFVPVLRDVTQQDRSTLRNALERFKQQLAARSIPRDELVDPTITLSNFGMIGGRFASLVVVPPQVAILGAGHIEARIVAVDGQPVMRRVLPLSLSFDHRVVTGAEATRFLNAVVADLREPDSRK